MRTLRHTLIVLAGLLLAYVGPAHAATTEIQLYFPVQVQGKLVADIHRLIGAFNKAHPGIHAIPVYTGGYFDTNLKMQAAIQAGRPPALVIASDNFVRWYAITSRIISLEPLLKNDNKTLNGFMGEFWPGLSGNAVINGHLYGVPFQNSTPLLYYSVDAFKSAGLNPDDPPVTWKEFVADAKKLTVRQNGGVERYGFEMPGTSGYLSWIVEGLVMSNGGEFYNHTYGGEVYFDQPSTLGTFELLNRMANKWHVMPQGVTDANAVTSAFFTGHAAMMDLSNGALTFVRENMKRPFKVAFMPFNVSPAAPIGGASLVIPSGNSPARIAAAWTLAKWLVSPSISGEWSRVTGYFAPRIASYDLPVMKAYLEKFPDAKVALEQMKFAVPLIDSFDAPGVTKALEDQVQALLSGRTTPERAAISAQRSAEALMKPYVAATALSIPH